MFAQLMHRLQRRLRRRGAPRRVEICPPARLQGAGPAAPGWRADIREWLSTPWQMPPRDADSAARAGVVRVRDDFLEEVLDIRTQQSGMLQERIRSARSLRELWHLRPEVFGIVSLRYSQAEAQTRLERLNRHFPTRSPRSGFAPLEAAPQEGASRTPSDARP